MKPFRKPEFTMFNNFVLDHIMPDLSSSAWKVLCVAIRQTIGWVDESTDSGRKESDIISYSQFREKSGIRSDTTISRALTECLSKEYLLRVQVGIHPGSETPIFAYSLNQDYEVATPENGVEGTGSTPENGVEPTEATPESEVGSTPENGETKERKKGQPKRKGSPNKLDPLLFPLERRTAENQESEGVWSVPLEAGGDSSLSNLLCNVFAKCSDIDPPEEQERQMWMRAFDKVLKRKKVTDPDIAVPALQALLDPRNEEFSYYTYANPTVRKFQDDYGLMLARFRRQDREDQDQEILPEEPYEPVYMPMPELKPKPLSEDERIWQAALGELQLQMTKATFDTWLKHTRLISRHDGVFVVEAQNENTRDWLENRLLTTIKRTLVGIVGHPVTVKFEVST